MKPLPHLRSTFALLFATGMTATAALADGPQDKTGASVAARPERGEREARSTPRTAAEARVEAGALAGKQTLDLNTAEFETLASNPAIGPETAKAIVEARPFTKIDDLDRLQGISAERLEEIRANVTVITPHVVKVESLAPDRAGPESGGIDINTADLETLQANPAIGPDVARQIVAMRPFATQEELNRLQGVNAEQLEQIRAAVVVADPAPAAKRAPSAARRNEERPLEPTGREDRGQGTRGSSAGTTGK